MHGVVVETCPFIETLSATRLLELVIEIILGRSHFSSWFLFALSSFFRFFPITMYYDLRDFHRVCRCVAAWLAEDASRLTILFTR